MNDNIREYIDLRNEIDAEAERLFSLHSSDVKCRKGCDQCCMDFGILPVEYHAIEQQAGDALLQGKEPREEGGCPFLVNHQCVIYHSRPIICRTQGLPILFMGEEQWELSACELNFTKFDFDDFDDENTFPQDTFNSRLFMINKNYIESLPGKPYSMVDLIPLSNLFKELG